MRKNLELAEADLARLRQAEVERELVEGESVPNRPAASGKAVLGGFGGQKVGENAGAAFGQDHAPYF